MRPEERRPENIWYLTLPRRIVSIEFMSCILILAEGLIALGRPWDEVDAVVRTRGKAVQRHAPCASLSFVTDGMRASVARPL
jgi:hypothetical protein